MKKIALILPYFGKSFPNYFDFWLESCRNNPSITWFIFTNIENSMIEFPTNVRVVKMEFPALVKRIEQLYPFKISLNTPYKLCDFRAAYGEIFSDYLKEYDFWGYCDCDLIFGNIGNFLTDKILDSYDRIYSRGHLSIFRNTPEVNSFYKKSLPNLPDYKTVFSSPKGYSFDEWGGTSRLWKAYAADRFYDNIDFDDIHIKFKHFVSYQKYVLKLAGEPKRNVYFLVSRFPCWAVKRVSDKEEETLYVHLQKRTMKIAKIVKSKDKEYVIVPNKFLPKAEICKPLRRWFYCRRRFFYWSFLKFRFKILKSKILRSCKCK